MRFLMPKSFPWLIPPVVAYGICRLIEPQFYGESPFFGLFSGCATAWLVVAAAGVLTEKLFGPIGNFKVSWVWIVLFSLVATAVKMALQSLSSNSSNPFGVGLSFLGVGLIGGIALLVRSFATHQNKPADSPAKPAVTKQTRPPSRKEVKTTPDRIIPSPNNYALSHVPDPSMHAAKLNASKLKAVLAVALSVIVIIIAFLNNPLSSTQADAEMCEALHKKTYHAVAEQFSRPQLALVKCYRANALLTLSGTVATADPPKPVA